MVSSLCFFNSSALSQGVSQYSFPKCPKENTVFYIPEVRPLIYQISCLNSSCLKFGVFKVSTPIVEGASGKANTGIKYPSLSTISLNSNTQLYSNRLITNQNRKRRNVTTNSSSSSSSSSSQVETSSTVETPPQLTNFQILSNACTTIRQMGRQGNLKGAIEVMDNLQALKIQPDIMVATALIDCCIRCNEISKAERAFNALFSKDSLLTPDSIATSVLLSAYAHQRPPQWGKMERFMSEMYDKFGLKPSIAEFNELVNVCARENHLDKGIEVLDRMKEQGMVPNEETMNAVKRRRVLRSHFRRIFSEYL